MEARAWVLVFCHPQGGDRGHTSRMLGEAYITRTPGATARIELKNAHESASRGLAGERDQGRVRLVANLERGG